MNTALAHGMRELSAAEILMVSGGESDGGGGGDYGGSDYGGGGQDFGGGGWDGGGWDGGYGYTPGYGNDYAGFMSASTSWNDLGPFPDNEQHPGVLVGPGSIGVTTAIR